MRTEFLIQRLADVLQHSGAGLSRGAIVSVKDGRHRVRSLLIGS
jgi:hypothetical protein